MEKTQENSLENMENPSQTLDMAGTMHDQSNFKSTSVNNNHMFTEESTIKIESHAVSALSHLSEQSEMSDYFVTATSYRQFIIALIQYVIGENECMNWMSLGKLEKSLFSKLLDFVPILTIHNNEPFFIVLHRYIVTSSIRSDLSDSIFIINNSV